MVYDGDGPRSFHGEPMNQIVGALHYRRFFDVNGDWDFCVNDVFPDLYALMTDFEESKTHLCFRFYLTDWVE